MWTVSNASGTEHIVYARLFDATGAPRGEPFVIADPHSADAEQPAIAIDADGNFTVAWRRTSDDYRSSDIYARFYDAAGVPLGDPFRVNSVVSGFQSFPHVETDPQGNTIIFWNSDAPGNLAGIRARRFGAQGLPTGPEFGVRTDAPGFRSDIAMSEDGKHFLFTFGNNVNSGIIDVYLPWRGAYTDRTQLSGCVCSRAGSPWSLASSARGP